MALNKDDEIAWLVLGLAQMRLGEDQQGLETVKGALTLLGRAMRDGYREYPEWDPNRVVRTSLRRAVLMAAKGLEEKNDLARSLEALLDRIDDEEWRAVRLNALPNASHSRSLTNDVKKIYRFHRLRGYFCVRSGRSLSILISN